MIKTSLTTENKRLPKSVKKYLSKYAEDNWEVELNSANKFEAIVVIPTLAEFEYLPKLIQSINKADKKYSEKYLILFVVNNTVHASEKDKSDNQKSLEYLRLLTKDKTTFQIAIIDATSIGKELPNKNGGVGLARKIGMDLALTLLDYNSKNQKFLVCLDADCTISQTYFTEIYENVNQRKIKAGYVRFEHLTDVEPYDKAIANYEIFLRYYQLGLRYANSRFAFYTIGSTILVDCEAYISIEGMNKRLAAEDFYFMEKLSKKYKIHEINSAIVFPSSRGSYRVPFGTGQRVNRFLSKEVDEFLLYSPSSFEILKKWNELFYSDNYSVEFLLNEAKSFHPELYKFLIDQKFEISWTKILSNNSNPQQIEKQKTFWFDGFRTLKLIHHLRDNAFPDEHTFLALNKMFELNGISFRNAIISSSEPDKENLLLYLNVLKENV